MTKSAAVQILEARSEKEYAEVAQCMSEFLAWMRTRYAERIWIIERYFDQKAWDDELAALSQRYPPPAGAVLLATVDGQPAGCVMFHDLGDRICEMKRLFVKPQFQGLGLGRRLTVALLELARERNYLKMRLDTGPLQPEAVALYQSLRFTDIGWYHDYPEDLKQVMRYMEREL